MTTEEQIRQFRDIYARLRQEIGKVIVGHNEIVEGTLTAIFAGGHVLLEGVPGLGKTLLVRTLGEVLELSDRPIDRFRFSDRLWTRVVYDFLLAYRSRTVYRSHATQSLAPLYLGRAASVILDTQSRPPAAIAHSTTRLCGVFEDEKPYLVDRWR